jgi:hypothetical protein
MSTTLSLIAQGTFTSDGEVRTIELPQEPHYFVIRNRSQWGNTPDDRVESTWFYGYSSGQSTGILEDSGGALEAAADAAGGDGFTFINLSDQDPGSLVATGTAITAANPAVVSDANTPNLGDIVRVYNTTGMMQIAGMDFSVTAVNPGTSYTLGYLDASGFGAAATNVDYRIIPSAYYSPSKRFITKITQASSAVITMSVAHDYVVGDKIRINVPDEFGMTEINGLLGEITAVSTSTITVDIDSSAFTAFAFPTSAVAASGVSFPFVNTVGEVATKFDNSLRNTGYYALKLGSSVVGSNSDVMDWMAFARDYTI